MRSLPPSPKAPGMLRCRGTCGTQLAKASGQLLPRHSKENREFPELNATLWGGQEMVTAYPRSLFSGFESILHGKS